MLFKKYDVKIESVARDNTRKANFSYKGKLTEKGIKKFLIQIENKTTEYKKSLQNLKAKLEENSQKQNTLLISA